MEYTVKKPADLNTGGQHIFECEYNMVAGKVN